MERDRFRLLVFAIGGMWLIVIAHATGVALSNIRLHEATLTELRELRLAVQQYHAGQQQGE